MPAPSGTWRSRIVGTGEENPKELQENPANWRRHPPGQRTVLGQALDEVGWVTQVIKNKRTGNLVDGHVRVELAVERDEPSVPVTYVDLSEDEERLVLASLDPIGALAETDAAALDTLLASLSIDGELNALLQEMVDLGQQSNFLADMTDGDAENPFKDSELDPPEEVSLTFAVTAAQRTVVMTKLRGLMRDLDLPTLTDALLHALDVYEQAA
jgi:hypothetical protein